jgi:hypothetical protein
MIKVTVETKDGVIFCANSADFEEVANTFRDHAAAMGVTVATFLRLYVEDMEKGEAP